MKSFLLNLLLLVFLVPSYADQKDASNISNMVSSKLFELDIKGIESSIVPYLKEKNYIHYLKIIESVENEVIFSYKKSQKNYVLNGKVQENCSQHQQTYFSDIVYEDEKIGKVILCTDKRKNQLILSEKELQWLNEHPVITVHNENNWAPLNFNKNGIPIGLSIDYMNLLANKIGVKVKYVSGEWNDLINMAINKKLDVMLNTAKSKEREKFLLFTGKYLDNKISIFTHKDSKDITDMNSLEGKKVAIVQGFIQEYILKDKYPKIQRVITKNIEESLKLLAQKKVDATIDSYITSKYLADEMMLEQIVHKGDLFFKDGDSYDFRLAIRNDYPILQSILQKAMATVSAKEMHEIRKKWMSSVAKEDIKLKLNKKEIEWISKKHTIRFAVDPNWLPIEAINNKTNKYEGMMADYLARIEELTGINFELVSSKRWRDSIKLVKSKKVDMLAATSITPEKKKFLNFSEKTLELTDGIIMRSDSSFVTDIDELQGLRIGIPEGTSLHTMFKNKYPQLILVPIKGTLNGINKLLNKQIDAYLGNLEAISHLIFKKNILNLKVVLKLEKSRQLHIAMHKDYPIEALTVINKAINSITTAEINTIRKRWIGLKVNSELDYSLLWKISLGIAIVFLLIGLYNRKLKQMVEEKTKELTALLNSFDKNVIASKTDLNGNITYASEAFCKISGYTQEELLGKTHNIIKHPDTEKETFKNLWETIKSGNIWKNEVKNLRSDGSYYWVEAVINPDYDDNGNITGYSSIKHDITSKKELEELKENLEMKIQERTIDLEKAKEDIEEIHKHTQESIEYASLIQHSLIPEDTHFAKYFDEYFTIWKPKDIVGGDIYLFEEIREGECIFMVIDCTGHGVPGAFVTMLVKAIERQIISILVNNKNKDISPAWILSYFNKTMKYLLKQEDASSISNAGFDGGILYYNKKENIVKFAGAETSLFYIEDKNIKIIKGNRHSIGYKKSDASYKFKEHTIHVKKGMSFYLSTDGYLDQNGGDKGFPFGRKRFKSILEDTHNKSFEEQEKMLLNSLDDYQKNEDRNDDITVVGIKI